MSKAIRITAIGNVLVFMVFHLSRLNGPLPETNYNPYLPLNDNPSSSNDFLIAGNEAGPIP